MIVRGIIGWKDSGKTGLVERLVSELTARGLGVSTIKHTHHSVDLDRPGRDSHRHREAGAREVILASAARVAVMSELRGAPEPGLEALVARLAPVDVVLVEGYRHGSHPRIEAHRAGTGRVPLAVRDETILAVASDDPGGLAHLAPRPVFDLDDIVRIADFLLAER